MSDKHFLESVNGIDEYLYFDDGDETVSRILEVPDWEIQKIIQQNIDEQNQGNNGYGKTREWQKVASIPLFVIQIWNKLYETNVMAPENDELFNRLLNDYDNQFLRTSKGKV